MFFRPSQAVCINALEFIAHWKSVW